MSAVELRVTRITESKLSWTAEGGEAWPNTLEWLPFEDTVSPADAIAEFSGRACYESWHRPNPRTAATSDYLAHVIEIGHESVLAHTGVAYYVTGVTRTLTHELIRHRFLTFSQLSQRYVELADDLPYVLPPLARGDKAVEALIEGAALDALASYRTLVEYLRGQHPERTLKEIRQAARCVLPGMTETRLVVGGNLRAWRDFLKLRLAPGADEEIREFAEALLADLKDYAPDTFQDFQDIEKKG